MNTQRMGGLKGLIGLIIVCAIIAFMPVLTNAATITHTYDVLNRLIMTVYSDGVTLTTMEYEYDDAGNMTAYSAYQEPIDTDSDGLPDVMENGGCTEYDDADSDNDGILDGDEDLNKDGVLDQGETDPCDVDSDGDGIQDGTELGLTLGDIGPDTDTGVFSPDLDSSTMTDPLNPDSDGDGLSDGQEDSNFNGRFDARETDPNTAAIPGNEAMPWIPLLLLGD